MATPKLPRTTKEMGRAEPPGAMRGAPYRARAWRGWRGWRAPWHTHYQLEDKKDRYEMQPATKLALTDRLERGNDDKDTSMPQVHYLLIPFQHEKAEPFCIGHAY